MPRGGQGCYLAAIVRVRFAPSADLRAEWQLSTHCRQYPALRSCGAMRLPLIALLGCLMAGCATDAVGRPLTEADYQAAATHCGRGGMPDWVIRLRRDQRTMVPVNGIEAQKRRDADVAYIECIRSYLGVPSDKVMIVSG